MWREVCVKPDQGTVELLGEEAGGGGGGEGGGGGGGVKEVEVVEGWRRWGSGLQHAAERAPVWGEQVVVEAMEEVELVVVMEVV